MSKKARRIEGRFAAIPDDVMRSDAWRTLPHGARSVLTVLAAQYAGVANGVQNLTRDTCRKYGLDHSRAMKAAKLLEARGLILCTFRSKYTSSRSRVPSQWALAWLDITHRQNQLLGHVEKAPNGWRIWRPTKIQSGRNDRSGLGTAVEATAAEVTDCGRNAQRISKNCGRNAQPSKNLGVPSATQAVVVGAS